MNNTINYVENEGGGLHCSKDALTDIFGWFLQVLLACLAFTCLIGKRFCEPLSERRSWLIWFYDTSKQGMGALLIHLANVYLAGMFQGDPCTWYIINFLLDSSVGLFIIWVGIRISQYLAKTKGWENINFGEYGKPPSMNAWMSQCALYVFLMIIVKICITLLIQFRFWDDVRSFILSPFHNPKIEVAFVMLIIPFFVNLLMFWVTDNFLMHRSKRERRSNRRTHDSGLLNRVKVRYRSIRSGSRNSDSQLADESDSEQLISADEELLGSLDTSIQQRSIHHHHHEIT